MRPLAQGLWVTERPQRFLGVEVGTRMTVVGLGGGGLLVHSPVRLDPTTRAALDGLGPVRAVVAPNRFHHLYVGDYVAAYPGARVYAAPGLPEKRPDLAFHGVLGDAPPLELAADLEQLVFRSMPFFNEVTLFHRASRTLILTDLAFNVRHTPSLAARVFLRLDGAYGRFAFGRFERLLVRDRQAARAAIDRMLAWAPERIVVAHGDVLETGARAALRTAFAWL